jgi:hypothetical protein
LFRELLIAGTLRVLQLAVWQFCHACEGGRRSMMITYLSAAALALVARIVLGWVDAPFLIGCLFAGTVIGAVEYYYLQKDRKYDARR